MKIINSINEWRSYQKQLGIAAQSLGLVATMGNLHAGHLSLMQQSIAHNAKTVLSIFVNPTQFNDAQDLQNYPRTLAEDVALAEGAGVDVVFTPEIESIYPDNYRYKMTENKLSQMMEGAVRPGHFDGMLTIVLKLLTLLQPTHAYFGAKDFQQYLLIHRMVDAVFLNMEIIVCDTVRETDGLAMSSRNSRLTAEQRAIAPLIYRYLQQRGPLDKIELLLQQSGFVVEYLTEYEGRRYVAARLGNVRLIDNIVIPE